MQKPIASPIQARSAASDSDRAAGHGASAGAGPGTRRGWGIAGPFRALARGWRILRTGFSFVSLAVICLALAFPIIPILHLWPGSSEEKEIRAQRAIHYAVRGYMRLLQVIRIARIEVEGGELLRAPGQLVVSNHPSLLDAFLLISLMPQADCVIKGSNRTHPILGGPARGAGYVPNWDGPSLVEDCVERLANGRSLIIFPEGTRSPVGTLGPFARGAAHIALRSGKALVPVTIECDPATLYRGLAWWDVPPCRFTLRVRVGDPIRLESEAAEKTESVADVADRRRPKLGRAARAATELLRAYFARELGYSEERSDFDDPRTARSGPRKRRSAIR